MGDIGSSLIGSRVDQDEQWKPMGDKVHEYRLQGEGDGEGSVFEVYKVRMLQEGKGLNPMVVRL